ncbi:MAG: YdcH family protein [Brevundimonas sp.]|jgi:hypothetical protein
MNDDAPEISKEEAILQARLKLLRLEHTDLAASIEALSEAAIPDQLMIARLKRKKLAIKDEIAKIEDQILPDIIA